MTKDRISDYDRQNRIAGGWLLYVDDRREETEKQIADIVEASASSLGGEIRASGAVGDPTARKAIELSTPEIILNKNWLALIGEVETKLPENMRVFLFYRRKYRYYRGRQGWIAPVQRKYAAEMAKIENTSEVKTWRSERTLGTYWEKLVDYTVRMAIKRGLLT